MIFFTFMISLCVLKVSSDLTGDYYAKLIHEGIDKASKYKLPTRNVEFKKGYQSQQVIDFGEFDFIIVGAGSAGSVVATRLSEISAWRILLLEAGGEETEFSSIPAMLRETLSSDLNWGYFSVPQKNGCLAFEDQKCPSPRGKGIGGCSAINSLVYSRGNRKDYDNWEKLGNPGWSYDDVLPYFKKSENSQVDGNQNGHGKGGFWNVENAKSFTELRHHIFSAAKELNIPSIDYNRNAGLGIATPQSNILHGVRQSTGKAFLDKARRRRNLKIVTKALVTKIIFDSSDKNLVKGVEFINKNKKYQVFASKEVILSAGAINTPQLLMLSGIGSKNDLETLNIPVNHDLPAVGRNLIEHPGFIGLIFEANYTGLHYSMPEAINLYLQGQGPLSSTEKQEALYFTSSKDFPKNWPNIEIIIENNAEIFDKNAQENNSFGIKEFTKQIVYGTFASYITLFHPKSRGSLTLKSNNPIDYPNIDFNLLSEEEDVEALVDGIEQALNFFNAKAFQNINLTLIDSKFCTNFQKYSIAYWKCAVRHLSISCYHTCGTTAMGSNQTTSVVDTNLKVHGVKRLRVVDAGVFPATVSGHTNAPTVMVAEKISDTIKAEYCVKFVNY